MYRTFVPLSALLDREDWPLDFFVPVQDNFLDSIHLVEHSEASTPLSAQVRMRVAFASKELSFKIRGLGEYEFGFAGSDSESVDATALLGQLPFEDQGQDRVFQYDEKGLGEGWVEIAVTYSVTEDEWELVLHDATIELAFPKTVLSRVADPHPLPGEENDSDSLKEAVKLSTSGDLAINQDWVVSLDGFDSFDLPYCTIGQTGVNIRAKEVQIAFFNGLQLTVGDARIDLPRGALLPPFTSLEMKSCTIDKDGVSGIVDVTIGALAVGRAADGSPSPFQIRRVELELLHGSIVRCLLSADVQIPFFAGRAEAEVSLDNSGHYAVRLSGAEGALKTIENNVFRLELDDLGV